ncbi:MAG: cytochrome c [Acidobacteria bacterium]|nr:cytochrome c [Acidobacteriota bacterium]
MMKTKLIITVALIFAFVAACGKGDKKDGKIAASDTYMRSCAACHGMDGEGRPIGSLSTPSFKREDALNYSDEQLFEKIYQGSSNMPAFKNRLTEEQIKSLVRFIREEIQGHKPKS